MDEYEVRNMIAPVDQKCDYLDSRIDELKNEVLDLSSQLFALIRQVKSLSADLNRHPSI